MTEFYNFGTQLRDLLRGLLQPGAPAQLPPVGEAVIVWGPRIDLRGLKDLYAPQGVKPFTLPPAGIDNLALTSTDTFMIPGRGEFQVNFKGYFRVARDKPTTDDWATAETHVNMIDIKMRGESEFGPITVSINPNVVSAGQVLAPGVPNVPAKCRIAGAAFFDMPQLGMSTLFNKEPILLMNDGIAAIPPVEDPNGAAHIYNLPLYDRSRPNGRAVAYLTSLRYTVGDYITEAEAKAFREQL